LSFFFNWVGFGAERLAMINPDFYVNIADRNHAQEVEMVGQTENKRVVWKMR
jgi:hypothetical protein